LCGLVDEWIGRPQGSYREWREYKRLLDEYERLMQEWKLKNGNPFKWGPKDPKPEPPPESERPDGYDETGEALDDHQNASNGYVPDTIRRIDEAEFERDKD
jgi:hypothetical protein